MHSVLSSCLLCSKDSNVSKMIILNLDIIFKKYGQVVKTCLEVNKHLKR